MDMVNDGKDIHLDTPQAVKEGVSLPSSPTSLRRHR